MGVVAYHLTQDAKVCKTDVEMEIDRLNNAELGDHGKKHT